jgi:phosphate-selective porin OprO/OprP
MDLNYHAGSAGAVAPTDAIRGGEEQDISAGLNWYPNSVVRFMLDYQHVHIDRLSPATAANAGTVWFTPVGAQIGQTYNAVAIRSQFAF